MTDTVTATTQRRYAIAPRAASYSVSVQSIRKRCEKLWPWHRGHWHLSEDDRAALLDDLERFPPRHNG